MMLFGFRVTFERENAPRWVRRMLRFLERRRMARYRRVVAERVANGTATDYERDFDHYDGDKLTPQQIEDIENRRMAKALNSFPLRDVRLNYDGATWIRVSDEPATPEERAAWEAGNKDRILFGAAEGRSIELTIPGDAKDKP